MQLAFTIAHMLVRICGILLLILGLLIWAENASNLVGIHMLLGIILVIALIVMGVLAAMRGAPLSAAIGLIVAALIVGWLGFSQTSLLPEPNPNHWIIRVIHLLVGMAAIIMAEIVGGRLRRASLATATT